MISPTKFYKRVLNYSIYTYSFEVPGTYDNAWLIKCMKCLSINSPATNNGSNPSNICFDIAAGIMRVCLSLADSFIAKVFLFSGVSCPPYKSLYNTSLILFGNPPIAPKFPCITANSSANDKVFIILMKIGRFEISSSSSTLSAKLDMG